VLATDPDKGPRFKMRYRIRADALAAKVEWEQKGKIVWPEVFKNPKSAKRLETQMGMRQRESGTQQEMRP
jgi:hypothetical protein